MGGGIAEIEIDSAGDDVVYDDVFARRPESQRALVLENVTGVLKFIQVTLVEFCALALQVRSVVAADMRTFVPVQAEPFKPPVNGDHRFLGIALRIRVFNAQNEFAAVMARK